MNLVLVIPDAIRQQFIETDPRDAVVVDHGGANLSRAIQWQASLRCYRSQFIRVLADTAEAREEVVVPPAVAKVLTCDAAKRIEI